jgi:anti-sigma B factor antagonist
LTAKQRSYLPGWQMTIDVGVDEGVAFLTAVGDLDMATAEEFQSAAESVLTGFTGTLRIDMSGVGFMDSTGVGALVAIRNKAELSHHTVIVENPSLRVLRVLELTGLIDVFQVITA